MTPSTTTAHPPETQGASKPADRFAATGAALRSRERSGKGGVALLWALGSLVALWALQLYLTWGNWGNLTIDSGHEMYIPSLLAQGKTLYKDVWFFYGPAGPYITSYLYRIFGIKLDVLYWAGSLSALAAAVFLLFTGRRLGSQLIGWTAGAVILLEVFQPSLFCFPLPYTSAAVYACVVGCAFLWVVTHACGSTRWGWMLAAGTLAALELMLKPEFGMASYGTLLPLMIVRALPQRSWKQVIKDAAAILPGVAACAAIIGWMVSLESADFITHENLVFWPTSYFMKEYGKMWLERNGFTISAAAFLGAAGRTIPIAAAMVLVYLFAWRKRRDRKSLLIALMVLMIAVLYLIKANYFLLGWDQSIGSVLATVFFPQDMVLYLCVAAPIAWLVWWFRRDGSGGTRGAAFALVMTYSVLVAFRILMNMRPSDYPIYYNGCVVLCFLMLACLIVPRKGRSRRYVLAGEAAICALCLIAVLIPTAQAEYLARGYVPLTTERGTVNAPKHLVEGYKAAIAFMKEKAAVGQVVFSVPEDTSLYFFSQTECPTRVFSFTPGVLAPGKMTDKMIAEIDRKPVDYLLWSNRTFHEYGKPIFGVDFDQEVGQYLKSHYHRVGPLIPNTGYYWEWAVVVWERNRDAPSPPSAN